MSMIREINQNKFDAIQLTNLFENLEYQENGDISPVYQKHFATEFNRT